MTHSHTVSEARLPAVCASKAWSRQQVYLEGEAPFETFFLQPDCDTNYPANNGVLCAAEATETVEYPCHWIKTSPLLFLPCGFSNSQSVRLSYLGKNK